MYRSFRTALVAVVFASACTSAVLAAPRTAHTVMPGETLASVAAREHVTEADLARINDLEGSAAALEPGTILAVDSDALPQMLTPVPPQATAELKAIETISQMPSANADLQMWSVGAGSPADDGSQPARTAAKTVHRMGPLHRFASSFMSGTSAIAMSLRRDATRFIGTPYVFGGTSPSGFDCSGYVQHVFAMLGIALPRTADAQFYASGSTHGNLVLGDLVFFQTYEPGPSHVGIYMGGGRFIHSSSHGVMISRLGDSYWSSRYLGSKRVARLASR